jgi:hypothetical protein
MTHPSQRFVSMDYVEKMTCDMAYQETRTDYSHSRWRGSWKDLIPRSFCVRSVSVLVHRKGLGFELLKHKVSAAHIELDEGLEMFRPWYLLQRQPGSEVRKQTSRSE